MHLLPLSHGLYKTLRPEFLGDFFFQIKGRGQKNKKSSENDQLTGHFQSFKTSKVNQQSVLNL